MGTFLGPGSTPFPKAGYCDTRSLLRNSYSEGLWVGIPGGRQRGACPARPRPLRSFLNSVLFLLQSYNPTVFERYHVNLQIKGKPVQLQIWDTAGRFGALEGARKRRGAPVAYEPGGQLVFGGQALAIREALGASTLHLYVPTSSTQGSLRREAGPGLPSFVP